MQRVVNAFHKALKWLEKATPEQVAETVPPEYLLGDKALYMRALQASRPMYSKDGIVSPAGMKNAYEMLVQFDEELKGAKVDLAKTFDGRFVQKASAGMHLSRVRKGARDVPCARRPSRQRAQAALCALCLSLHQEHESSPSSRTLPMAMSATRRRSSRCSASGSRWPVHTVQFSNHTGYGRWRGACSTARRSATRAGDRRTRGARRM